VPRTINVICDNALIGAFASQARPIMKAMVEEVCRDFDLKHFPAPQVSEVAGDVEPAVPVNGSQRSHADGATDAGPTVAVPPPSILPDPARDPRAPLFRSIGRKSRFSFF
jgi:hypothetical protein